MSKTDKTQVLKDLNATLQVHAERIRLQPSDWLVESASVKLGNKLNGGADRHNHPKEVNTDKLESARSMTKTSSRSRYTTHSSRSIRSYRVGYTWNRGGRLKELRIRHLARKFSGIWKRRVFGRVLPSQARSHYNKVLYRKVFTVLYDDWWSVRKEWRLQLRAECHDRFRLHSKYWKAWKDLVIMRREDNSKLCRAVVHANGNLLRKCLFIWQIYTEQSKIKSALKKRANDFYTNQLLSKTMDIWRGALEKRRGFERVEEYASCLYNLNLLSRMWRKWTERQSNISSELEVREKADRFYELRVKNRAWEALRQYHSYKQRKLILKDKALKYRREVILKRHLEVWYQRLRQTVQIQLKEEIVIERARVSCMRRVFLHWTHYILLNKQNTELQTRAENHHNCVIKAKCLEALRHAVVLRNLKLFRQSQAMHFYHRGLLRWSLRRWMVRTEEEEENRLHSQTEVAQEHCRVRVLVRAIDCWREYTVQRQRKKEKQEAAYIHHLSSLLPKYFQIWRDYISLQKWKSHIAEQSALFYRQNVEARFFYLWQATLQKKMDIGVMERMAEMHHQEKVKSAALNRWRCATSLLLDDYENTHLACEHYQLHMKKKFLTSWRMAVCQSKQEREELVRGKNMENYLTLKKYLTLWIQWLQDQKSEQRRYDTALQHHSKAMYHLVLSEWRKQTKAAIERKKMAEEKYNQHRLDQLSECLKKWRQNSKVLQSGRQRVEVFTHKIDLRSVSQAFTAWREYSRKKSLRRREENLKIDSLKEKYDRIRGLGYLRLWRSRQDERVLSTLKYNQAIIHHERKSLTAAFSLWRQGVQVCKQVKVLKKQAVVVNTHLTLGKALYRWRQRLSEAKVMTQKTYNALLHWSLTVERKCLISWFYYAEKRKQKKALYSQAFQLYKDELLLTGVRQWFTVADRMAVIREKIATDQYSQRAYRIQCRVERCFYHWRAVTLKHRKPPSPQSIPQPTVPLQPLPPPLPPPILPIHPPLLPTQSKLLSPTRLKSQSLTPAKQDLPTLMERNSKPALASPLKLIRSPSKPSPASLETLTSTLLQYDVPKPQHSSSHGDPVRKKRAAPKQPSYLMASLEREGLWKTECRPASNLEDEVDHRHTAVSNSNAGAYHSPVKEHLHKPSVVSCLLKPSDITLPRVTDHPKSKSKTGGADDKENHIPGLLPPSAFTKPVNPQPGTTSRPAEQSKPQPEQALNQLENVHSNNKHQQSPENGVLQQRDVTTPAAEVGDYLVEIELIREKLMTFKRDRKRLRRLTDLKSQLTACLSCLPDGQVKVVQTEIQQLECDVSELTADLQNSKEECHLLSQQLDRLTQIIVADT